MAMISLRGQNLLLLPSKKQAKSDQSQYPVHRSAGFFILGVCAAKELKHVEGSRYPSSGFCKKVDLKVLKGVLNNFYKLIMQNVPALMYF